MIPRAWLFFATCLLLTYVLAHAYRAIAIRFHWMDHPDHRSAHDTPVPTGAGLVFVLIFVVALIAMFIQGLVHIGILYSCLGAIVVALVGFRDDVRAMPVPVRACLHLLAAAWCIYWIGFPSLNILGTVMDFGLAGHIFGVIALVWLLNLYNFMDGIDGIAAGEAAFVCLSALWLSGWPAATGWDGIVWMVAGLSTGFLLINRPPAKVFMGDVGSGFLGLLLGILALAHDDVSVWSWLILLGYFITDACLTITVRLIRGEKIYESHNLHAYQHLTRRIGGYRTLIIIMAVNFLWLLPMAYLAHIYPDWGLVVLVAASVPLLPGEFICGAGRRDDKVGYALRSG